MGRLDRDDSSLLVKLHPVGTNLTVYSRSLFGTDKVLVDTMIENIPLVLSRYLEYRVVGGALDFILRVLYQYPMPIGTPSVLASAPWEIPLNTSSL